MIASLAYQILYWYLKPFMSYRGFKRWKSDTYTHARTHTHTSGRQLKITFLDVLDYSEYSDTNISKKKSSRKHSFLSEEAKMKSNCMNDVPVNIVGWYTYYSAHQNWEKRYFFLNRKKYPGLLVFCKSAGHNVRDI